MRSVAAAPIARMAILAAVSLVLIGGAAATGSSTPAPPVPAVRPASLARHGAVGKLGPAQVSRAAQTCAGYAAAAGWANNGQYGGDLVIAVAVCVAESGGQSSVYYCDGTGTVGYYPPVQCPTGSYDRGLWQINSKYHPEVTDACAFRAQCNADAAYQISDQGTDFAPWAVYDTDAYAQYLGAAQQAVAGLTAGAVSAARFGVCAMPARPVPGAAVTAGRCGRRTAAQQWTVTGGTVRQGTLCLGAGTGQPAVTVGTCGGGASQTWAPYGQGELKNGGTGQCLRGPRRRGASGTALRLAGCTTAPARGKTWWLP